MYHSIRPGQPWLDTDRQLIQAHGGSVLYHEGVFYWYGENKAPLDEENEIWHGGISCYSSTDLYNWKNEGVILEPSTTPGHPLGVDRFLERPHILYNPFTKKFVMWIKSWINGNDDLPRALDRNAQYVVIAVADRMTGPYALARTFRPLGMETGDFDLWVDPRDYKSYFIADRVHTEIIVADLTEDYMDVTGHYSAHFPYSGPPEAREAPALFKRMDQFYMLTSGTTGYAPNPTQAAMAPLIHGPYTVDPEVCVADEKQTSFDCQFSCVLKHPYKEDLFIAIGDRWMNKVDRVNGQERIDTSQAGYVWLPIRFCGRRPVIVWMDEWTI